MSDAKINRTTQFFIVDNACHKENQTSVTDDWRVAELRNARVGGHGGSLNTSGR